LRLKSRYNHSPIDLRSGFHPSGVSRQIDLAFDLQGMQPENWTMNTSEFGLKAGVLLRRMRELASCTDAHEEELERVRAEAQALKEKWRALMAERNPDPQSIHNRGLIDN
jgi:hypothetical protein